MTKGLGGILASLLSLLLYCDLGRNLRHFLLGGVVVAVLPGEGGGVVIVLLSITEISGTDTAVLSRSGCGGLPAVPSRFFNLWR